MSATLATYDRALRDSYVGAMLLDWTFPKIAAPFDPLIHSTPARTMGRKFVIRWTR